MTIRHALRRTTVAAAAGLAIAICAGTALAQPMGGPMGGPMGPHGMGAPDAMIGSLIEGAKAQLNLNTMQQGMFDAAVANSRAARESGRAIHQKVRDALAAELGKTEPDLGAIAAAADDAQAQGQALRQTIRRQWLALYATFTPEQKVVVRDVLKQHLANADSFRQKMHDRMIQYFGGKSS